MVKEILEDAHECCCLPPFDDPIRFSSFKDADSSAGFGRRGLEVTLWGSN